MSEGAGGSSPKTLADVSHLFFSRTEVGTEKRDDAPSRPAALEAGARDSAESRSSARTRFIVVTGADSWPGKSTVAVNLAQALGAFGRVGVFDADPRIPNARFYLGMPSWHYLSPLTGGGEAAPNAVTKSGLVVADWSLGDTQAAGMLEAGDLLHAAARDFGREPVDFAIVDVPVARTGLLGLLEGRDALFVVVSGPGRLEFERAFVSAREVRRWAAAKRVGLVVNRAPDRAYPAAFHAKLNSVAGRLLNVGVALLGGVPLQPGLAAEQRERGPIVASRPSSTAALALREVATNVLEETGGRGA